MSTNRITGLASGMDYESIIEKLMKASRTPLDKLEKSQTKVEWQREALLEINSKFLAFRTSALDMKLQGTYKSYTADSTDKGAVSAIATSDAQEGTYKVSVSSLATKTTLIGTKKPQDIKSGGDISADDLDSLAGKSFNVTYNGETKTISFGDNDKPTTVAELQTILQSKIENAFGSNQIEVGFKYDKLVLSSATSLKMPITITSGATGADALEHLHIDDGASTAFDTSDTLENFLGASRFKNSDEMTISINGKDFTFNKTDTVTDVFNTLNKDNDANITIKYSDIKESMLITRDTYGAGRDIELNGDKIGDAFWKKLGLNYYYYRDNNKLDKFEAAGGSYTTGDNAVFSITSPDGETAQNVESASNTFTYNGVSMTFLEADPTKNVSITVSKNVDEVYDKIKGFTDSYNDLLVTLNKYYKEDTTGYDPLTDEERESLSDKQEEKWETMAKKGVLKRDSTLRDAISNMRSAVTSYVSGSSISSLFQIGISTSSYDSVNTENNGKLVVDEDKLKNALKNDLEGVTNLFASAPKQIQSSKLADKNLNLDGKSLNVTYGGETKTITLKGTYDLADSKSRTEFEDYMKEVFTDAFGEGRVSVSVSGDKVLFNSLKTVDMTFNISSEGSVDSSKDALALFGIKDGTKYDTSARGFATKIYDICTNTMNSIVDKAGASSTTVDSSTLGKQLERLQESIKKQKERLEMLEDRYYKQFTAMEEAISNMNSQSSSIMNLLNGNS